MSFKIGDTVEHRVTGNKFVVKSDYYGNLSLRSIPSNGWDNPTNCRGFSTNFKLVKPAKKEEIKKVEVDPGVCKIGDEYKVGAGEETFVIESFDRVRGDTEAYYKVKFTKGSRKGRTEIYYFPWYNFEKVEKKPEPPKDPGYAKVGSKYKNGTAGGVFVVEKFERVEGTRSYYTCNFISGPSLGDTRSFFFPDSYFTEIKDPVEETVIVENVESFNFSCDSKGKLTLKFFRKV